MALFDLPLDELQSYRPHRNEPADFDAFWRQTLAEAHQYPLDAQITPIDFGLTTLDSYDVTFSGFAGQPIKGWFLIPRQHGNNLPCVVQYIGYGGGRGFPYDWLAFPSAGYASLIMDTRGQGSVWRQGDTPDPDPDTTNPQTPGFMTRGIRYPQTYYYRRVFVDAVRAVEAACTHPVVDTKRIAVTGGSQGGGIALAVSGLIPDQVRVCMPNVPFLCHYRRASELVDTEPYSELAQYCKVHRDQVETVFQTLAYFDGVNFATRASAQALFSTALMDTTCPPSTVFAAYNHYAGPKQIKVWPYNDHEGGETFQLCEQIAYLKQVMGV